MAETRLITLSRPDDWHVHLRDGDVLAAVAPLTARRFARAVVMPNLVPRSPPPANIHESGSPTSF